MLRLLLLLVAPRGHAQKAVSTEVLALASAILPLTLASNAAVQFFEHEPEHQSECELGAASRAQVAEDEDLKAVLDLVSELEGSTSLDPEMQQDMQALLLSLSKDAVTEVGTDLEKRERGDWGRCLQHDCLRFRFCTHCCQFKMVNCIFKEGIDGRPCLLPSRNQWCDFKDAEMSLDDARSACPQYCDATNCGAIANDHGEGTWSGNCDQRQFCHRKSAQSDVKVDEGKYLYDPMAPAWFDVLGPEIGNLWDNFPCPQCCERIVPITPSGPSCPGGIQIGQSFCCCPPGVTKQSECKCPSCCEEGPLGEACENEVKSQNQDAYPGEKCCCPKELDSEWDCHIPDHPDYLPETFPTTSVSNGNGGVWPGLMKIPPALVPGAKPATKRNPSLDMIGKPLPISDVKVNPEETGWYKPKVRLGL